MDVLISGNAMINGHGSQPWKWVSGLSAAERAAVRAGGLVFVRDYTAHHYTQSGWKVVLYGGKKYYHREPTDKQKDILVDIFRANKKGGAGE